MHIVCQNISAVCVTTCLPSRSYPLEMHIVCQNISAVCVTTSLSLLPQLPAGDAHRLPEQQVRGVGRGAAAPRRTGSHGNHVRGT